MSTIEIYKKVMIEMIISDNHSRRCDYL